MPIALYDSERDPLKEMKRNIVSRTNALSLVHDEVQSKVLDEVSGVEGERAAVERVEHRVTRSIGRAGAAIGLSALAVVQRLSSEGALVDLPLLCPREGKPIGLYTRLIDE